MLETLFGSKTRVKLLKLFLLEDGDYFVREIARMVGEKLNSVRRELENLEKLGLIKVTKSVEADKNDKNAEKKKYYTVDREFVLYKQLKELFLRSRLLAGRFIAAEIESLGQIKLLVLSGFFVDDDNSQTDLLIVGKINKAKLLRVINKISRDFGHEVKYTCMTTQEFNYRNNITDKFLFDVLEGKKIVLLDNVEKIF